MALLEESTTPLTKETQVFTSKLKNMKLHMTELLNKKLRLEIEIKSLKKTILNRQKEYERTLKVKLKVESSEIVNSTLQKKIREEDPQLHLKILDFDSVGREIQELLEEHSMLEEHEKF